MLWRGSTQRLCSTKIVAEHTHTHTHTMRLPLLVAVVAVVLATPFVVVSALPDLILDATHLAASFKREEKTFSADSCAIRVRKGKHAIAAHVSLFMLTVSLLLGCAGKVRGGHGQALSVVVRHYHSKCGHEPSRSRQAVTL